MTIEEKRKAARNRTVRNKSGSRTKAKMPCRYCKEKMRTVSGLACHQRKAHGVRVETAQDRRQGITTADHIARLDALRARVIRGNNTDSLALWELLFGEGRKSTA